LRAQAELREHPHAAFVEQTIQQPLAGQIRIDQFDVFDGRDQRLAFDPGVVDLDLGLFDAFGNVAGIEVLLRAFRRLGQELQQHAAGAPAMFWTIAAATAPTSPTARRAVGICSERENIHARRLPGCRLPAPPAP
jgi:hypothetical protein